MRSSRKFRIANDAQRDIRSILRYTAKRWGLQQEAIYSGHIEEALVNIMQHPELGHERDDLRLGIRRYIFEEHSVFYEVNESVVRVLRIVANSSNFRVLFS